MTATETRHARRAWPIAYRRRARTSPGSGTGIAWVLFLVLGLPFALMTVMTVLAGFGIYIELLRPLWQPWPPDLLKPFVGVTVFALTLAYLAYRLGHRSGFRAGTRAGMASARNAVEVPARESEPAAAAAVDQAPPPPPPPPEDIATEPL